LVLPALVGVPKEKKKIGGSRADALRGKEEGETVKNALSPQLGLRGHENQQLRDLTHGATCAP